MLRISKNWRMALFLALFAWPALLAGENRFEKSFSRTFTYRGGKVSVDHSFGGVTIDTGGGSEVSVRATIRSSDPDFAKLIQIVAAEEGNGVTVRTEYPEHLQRHNNFSYSVDYRITVPPSAPLLVKNRFGSIDARGIKASSEFINSMGSISLSEMQGVQRVQNSFGSVDVTNSSGDLTVRNQNGSIHAREVSGGFEATNRFGSVDIDNARTATIENTNGSVNAREIDGALKIVSGFGSVVASNVKGSADITNANGRIEVREVGGNATLKTSFGSIAASNIRGNLSVTGQNSRVEAKEIGGQASISTTFGSVDVRSAGSVSVENANGSVQVSDVTHDARIHTTFGSAFVKGVGGAVDVQNQSGAIGVSGISSSGCRPITLRTSFSSIRVALPANASYSVSAKTSFGRINSEFPITTRALNNETVVGTIGGGNCRLDLSNSNGSITIDRD
jgi:putative adhesin